MPAFPISLHLRQKVFGFQLGQLFGLDAHAVVADADIEQPLIPQRIDADAHHADWGVTAFPP